MEHTELMRELAGFSTPTITNVVATYPKHPLCLHLYDPWVDNWHTDDSIRPMFPEHPPRAGHAVTCVIGLPDRDKPKATVVDIMEALIASPKPTVFVYQQDFPPDILPRSGLLGEIMLTAMSKLGCVGAISNGPSRDLAEIRKLGIQFMLSGGVAGHGDIGIYAVNVPVTVAGMDVIPGDIVHMDVNGAVKFPADRLEQVVEKARAMQAEEEGMLRALAKAKTPAEIVDALMAQAQYGDYHHKAGSKPSTSQS